MIRTEQAHIPFFADTHAGMSGKNNEDSYAVTAYQLEDEQKTPALLAVLSDGIGGHRAGEVASRIAVDIISREVSESDGSYPPQTLTTAIAKANDQIYAQAQGADKKGMGATCSIALVIDNRLYTVTIGDSRIYLLRNGQIRQLSKDHTWIQEALDSGLIEPDQVEGHPNAHVIRRYLGAPTAPAADMRIRLTGKETDAEAEANQGMVLAPGDRILLCSDGLTDLVKDEEILRALQSNTMEAAVKSLIDLANQRGGHDNITIIVLSMPADYKTLAAAPRRRWMVGCLIALIIAVLAGGVVLAWMYKTDRLKQFILPLNIPQPPNASQTTTLTTTIMPMIIPSLTLTRSATATAKLSVTTTLNTGTVIATKAGDTGTAPSPDQTSSAGMNALSQTAGSLPGTQSNSEGTNSNTQPAQSSPEATSESEETLTVEPPPHFNTPTKPSLPTLPKPTAKPLPTWYNPFSK
jgi:serine/threonine protein phosphatase PrpC